MDEPFAGGQSEVVWSAHPPRNDAADPAAQPGVAPPEPPGVDPEEVSVDGETFVVSGRAGTPPGTYQFDWTSGPHRYGFTVGGPRDWQPERAELIEMIREFLADIDPETGYLRD